MNQAKLLIVDDIATNIEVLANALNTDYQLIIATDGTKALELARTQLPDLILLDIMMPELDGYEVCKRLKSDPITKDIPVIFISAMTNADDEEKGFAVGAVDYIHKPFKLALMRARVKNHVQLKQQADLLRAIAQMQQFGFSETEKLVAEIKQTLEKL